MKRQLFSILLLSFLLGSQYDSYSQQGCYKKYWERGELARKNSDWGQAVKHYEAAKRCDTLSRTTLEEIQRLIDLCYSSWASQLEAAKKMIEEQKYYVGFVAETMADENVQKGDFNKAFSLLNIAENKNSGTDYRKELLPYLSDTIFFNAVEVELFTHENRSIAAILEKKEQLSKKSPEKGPRKPGSMLYAADDDESNITEETKSTGGLFSLSFYDISGPAVKKIGRSIDSIQTLSSYNIFNIKKEGNDLIIITDCKIYFLGLKNLPAISRREIEYSSIPPHTFYKLPIDLHLKAMRVCTSLLDSGIYISYSNVRVDSSKTRMMYSLTLDNRRTGTINTVDSVYNFEYYPKLSRIAVQKYQTPKSYQFLILNCNNADQSVMMDNVSTMDLASDGFLTIYPFQSDSAKTISTFISPSFVKPRPKIYYEMKQQSWSKQASSFYYYHDSLKAYVTQTKKGYNLATISSGKVNVYDSLFNLVTSFRASQYVYSRIHDLIFIINKKPYTIDANRTQTTQDTLKIIGPALTDSVLLFGTTISMSLSDSVIAINNKSGLRLLAFGTKSAVSTGSGFTFQVLQFPGKNLLGYKNAGLRGYYLLYAKNEDATRYNDTLTLLYSEKKQNVVLEMPGKAETIDLGSDDTWTKIGLYIPNPRSNIQTIHILDTATQKVTPVKLAASAERLKTEAYLLTYYPTRNLAILAYEIKDSYDKEDEEETGEILEEKNSHLASLKHPTMEIQVHNLTTGNMERIFTRLDMYAEEPELLGNFLVLRGSEEDENYFMTGDRENNFSYFYNLHLSGNTRKEFYTRKHSKGSTKDLLIPVKKKSLPGSSY